MKATLYKILMIFSVLSLVGCQDRSSSETAETASTPADSDLIVVSQAQFDQMEMRLGKVQVLDFPVSIAVTGHIDVPPANRANVTSPLGGTIKTILFIEGDEVKQGQRIGTIENPEFIDLQQEYLEINEQLNYLKAEYERQKTLKEENITSDKKFLKAESDYKYARARATGLEKQLRLLHISPSAVKAGTISPFASILAPISGYITQLNVNRGTYISAADPIVEIINNDDIHLELKVFEKDVMKIKEGQKITFKIPESSAQDFQAEVHLVGTSISDDRTITVHGHLAEGEQGNFITGMFVQANIVTETTRATALPKQAVIEKEGGNYVLMLEKQEGSDRFFKPIEVKVLGNYDGFTQLELPVNIGADTQFLNEGGFALIGN